MPNNNYGLMWFIVMVTSFASHFTHFQACKWPGRMQIVQLNSSDCWHSSLHSTSSSSLSPASSMLSSLSTASSTPTAIGCSSAASASSSFREVPFGSRYRCEWLFLIPDTLWDFLHAGACSNVLARTVMLFQQMHPLSRWRPYRRESCRLRQLVWIMRQ